MANLDGGWRECHSNTYNRKYWFNEATGESVWEDPNISAGKRRQEDNDDMQSANGKVDVSDASDESRNPKRSKTEVIEILEEPPSMAIERERLRSEVQLALAEENQKYGEMKGIL